MSELRLVQRAEQTPGCCLRCQSHNGPFVDLSISHHVEDWLYLCVTCIDQIIRVRCEDGDPEVVARVKAELADALELVSDMREAMRERDRTLVSDFAEYITGHDDRPETVFVGPPESFEERPGDERLALPAAGETS